MKNSKTSARILTTVTAIVSVLLLVAVFVLMNTVQKLIRSDAEINLVEIVSKNQDVISSKLMLETQNLSYNADTIAADFVDQPLADDTFRRVIKEYATRVDDDTIFLASKEGMAFFPKGQSFAIEGRRYFRLAISGVPNISDRLISRLDDGAEEVFLFSMPLKLNGDIIGTIQRFYTPEEMSKICEITLFSEQGYMYIINSIGDIVISSENSGLGIGSGDYYRSLYSHGDGSAGKLNRASCTQLKADVVAGKSGFMETVISGESIFSAYTPIDGIHDWYLISSVAKNAVSPKSVVVVNIFYVVLLTLAIAFAVILFYITFNKRRQQRSLEKIAFVDPVTGGDTYNKFTLILREQLAKDPTATRGIVAFDIDNFKFINSSYGFDYGDMFLKRIHATIATVLDEDECVARVSGDHFVALVKDADEERVAKMIDSAVAACENKLFISAGIYKQTRADESIELMVDKAGTAVRSVKDLLRGKVAIYNESFDEEIARAELLKREIEAAILNGEFIPYYQPKIDIETGKLVGAEALARWIKPDGRIISPGEFIPLCERTGQIVDVDMRIFEQVLGFLRKNLTMGVSCVPISVNFSRAHLRINALIHNIIEKLNDYSVPPSLIQIELTETIIFENHEVILDFVRHMHEHGLSISIDDFGSGYSSLNMLKDIPVDVLKIDRMFFKASDDPKRRMLVLKAIVKMAQSLDIGIVAEGVETAENVELMREVGCTVAQGYYFARPMDTAAFDQIYTEEKF